MNLRLDLEITTNSIKNTLYFLSYEIVQETIDEI